MKNRLALVLLTTLIPGILAAHEKDLSGTWRFALDREDVGTKQKWFCKVLEDNICLPGSTISEGKGDAVDINTPWTAGFPNRAFFTDNSYSKYREKDNFKVPFFLQPETYYLGAAWYQRDIEITEEEAMKPVEFFLERCHWQSTMWIDTIKIGTANALSAPQRFVVEEGIAKGKHTLTIRVDNRIHDIDPGVNAHSISDHTQGNWNGIVGKMTLKVLSEKKIDSVRITPNLSARTIKVELSLYNRGKTGKSQIEYALFGKRESAPQTLGKGWNHIEKTFPIPTGARLWDEFDPYIYDITICSEDDLWKGTFGLRELTVEDNILKVNGNPRFMRGTLNCAQFPLTGYPATDIAEWIREFSICKMYGLNHIRFHSWCPPEAAFEAADRMGLYLYVECSAWAEIGVGRGIDQYFEDESQRIVYEFGNHPSFCFLSYGNEPGGKTDSILTSFVTKWKDKDPRRLYTGGAGWPNLSVSDFLSDQSPRIQRWGEGLKSIINGEKPSTAYDWSWYSTKSPSQTFISHEIGQWCVYPRFDEIKEYTGPYKARNFEIFRDRLEENGMVHLADSFLLASGRLQTLCYKADIEAALRTKGQGGYELLGLQDFSGQGTALVGALDAFWNEKGYTSAREYSEFQNSIVPLARMEKMVYCQGEKFEASVEIANFEKNLTGQDIEWKILDRHGNTVTDGTFRQRDIAMGNCNKVGDISLPLDKITAPAAYSLVVETAGHTNKWNFWVYPENRDICTDGILLTDTLNNKALETLDAGGKVLLSIRKGHLAPKLGGDVKVGFSSIFWNTSWTNGQPPHTLGILCNPQDKALSEFPTEYCSDWQWWDAMSHSGALRLDRIGGRPIVRVIDDWFTARPLALILEAKMGKGKIIVTGIDFFDDMENRPEGRQLMKSLLDYMSSEAFNPTEELKL